MNSASQVVRRFLAALAAASLAGCGGLLQSDAPATRTYWLEPPAIAGMPHMGGQSLAVVVTAVPGLDTREWLALEADRELKSYAAARWPDRAPDYIASLLQQSFAETGAWRRVVTAPYEYQADMTLELTLEALFVDRPAGAVRLRVSGLVTCDGTVEPVRDERTAAIGDEALPGIAAAWQSALDGLGASLATQIEAAACSAR